jgi:hypothetical protein
MGSLCVKPGHRHPEPLPPLPIRLSAHPLRLLRIQIQLRTPSHDAFHCQQNKTLQGYLEPEQGGELKGMITA